MIKLLGKMKAKEWLMALGAALLVLGQIFFDLKLPEYMSNLTILIQTPGSTVNEILLTGGKMLACTAASAAMAIICGYLSARVGSGFSFTIRELLFNKVSDFSKKEMLDFSVPSLINRTTNDVSQVQMSVSMGLQMIVKAPIMAVWAIIKIVTKSWTLSLITAGFVIFLLGIMSVMITVVIPRFKIVQKQIDKINLIARENLTGINVVHAFRAEDYQNKKFDVAATNLMKTQLFNQRTFALLMPLVGLAMNCLGLVIYWVGAGIINNIPVADFAGRLTMFSDVVVFSTYATYVIMSIMMLVMIVMFLPAAQVSAQRICEVLFTESDLHEGRENEAEEEGTVEFKNVSFRYPDSSENTLENISFKVNKGETIAFIGATGSGKTTLISLAARFYDATEGEIFVDGINVRDFSFDALYDRIGFVTQKAVLFAGDIKKNVLFGESRGEKTDKNAYEALETAQAKEFVEKLAGGINSPISQGGTNVSGGQKQRISIARALARKPEILIFDDSFSALDYKTDKALRSELDKKLSGVTKMIVAQRIGTIRNADQIVVLDEGKAVGIGTHSELMESCEVYREIAMSQLSEDELK
ncbi:MAG: ABC transporter ATP-binding protein [Ruminococcaceae bacterium]|nr:ABC transporter ATP-binding protein [Oscillospiraceae bacterium]